MDMQYSPKCIQLVKKWEGYHRQLSNGNCEAYPDVGSRDGEPVTIGYGTTRYQAQGVLKYGRIKVKLGDTLTQLEAESELLKELDEVAASTYDLNRNLTQNQFDACVSFFYNCGFPPSQFERLRKGQLDLFAAKMLEYTKGGDGKVLLGLVNRRQEEYELFNKENQKVAEPTWWGFHRNTDGKPSIVGYAGPVPVSRIDTNLVDDAVKALLLSKANTFVVSDKPAPDVHAPEKPKPELKVNRQKIVEEARSRCSKGRAHSPGNVIDTEVLDPLRPTMKRLGQMAQSDNDGFYNWCASNVTRILRDCGLTVPDQPIVNGKPFWATVALVETWKAWAIDKGAWRNSRQAEPGDIVIYDWDGNGVTDHIGIILETREGGVLAAEGNKGNREAIIYRDRSTFAGTINVEKLFNLNS